MRKEIVAVYSAGLIQGIVLTAFPAISTIITNPGDFNFTSTMYGTLFLPQSLCSIAGSALNPKLAEIFGTKSIFTSGLIANLLSMTLLALSPLFMHDKNLAHILLLIATGCLGLGFGLILPILNYTTYKLYPSTEDSHILILNALLGGGSALTPLFTATFVAFNYWWGLPILLCVSILLLLVISRNIDLPNEIRDISTKTVKKFPSRVWIFMAFALLYGIIETINGTWVSIYMKQKINANLTLQSLALTAFWGMVTFGRLFFASIEKFLSLETIYRISPFFSALAFIIISTLSEGRGYLAVLAFGLTGFGCSSLLPLTLSFASKQLRSVANTMPGMIIAFYLFGYGMGAFGVGPLEDMLHISLREIYILGAIISIVLGIISLIIVKPKNV